MTANPDPAELKSRVDLVAVFQAHQVEVKKAGKSFKALCPFHDEKTPSMSLQVKNGAWLYHCHGCSASGDAFTFLQKLKGLTFGQATTELLKFVGQPIPETPPPPDQAFPYDLMARVAGVWHQAFCQRPEGLNYLESRGLQDKELMRLFEVGYCDGEQILNITNAAERAQLQRVGVLNKGGKEFFSRCVVFPLKDRHGRVVGFYGRGTLPNAQVPHRYCPGDKTGLFYAQAAKGTQSVVLVEGVLDALALVQGGISNTMALGGTQGLTQALVDHLRAEKVTELILCLDGDEAGQKATETLTNRLTTEGFTVRSLSLPSGQDPLSLGAQAIKQLLTPEPKTKKRYKKLSAAQGKLKILVSIEHEGQKAEATLDLYSARSRRQEAALLARRLNIDCQELEDWLFQVLEGLEKSKGNESEAKELFAKVEVPPMTAQQRKDALAFLQRADLVDAVLRDMEALGYMGDEEAKLLGYCVSVSRKLDRPLSAIIQSGSGAGKSFLSETVQAMTPPEDVVFYSRLSPQALYHMPEDFLVHKLVVMEERAGGEACDYQIRALQSSNILKQCIVIKDPVSGQLHAKENTVLGPIAYMETTTKLYLNPENTSRCFEIPLDESPEQTRRIHERQKLLKSLASLAANEERQSILERHHHAQRLLERVPVVIPYVHLLTFPDTWLRARRDHDRFLHLIIVLAFLHQHQRPRKVHEGQEYIAARVSDYRWAYFLANRVLSQSMDELSRWAREIVTFFERNRPKDGLTRREIREALEWPERRAHEALDELVDMEFLEAIRGANNRSIYHFSTITGRRRSTTGLLHPDELETLWEDE